MVSTRPVCAMPQYTWNVIDPWQRVARHEIGQLLVRHYDVDVSGVVRQLTSPIDGTTVAIRHSATEAIRYSPVGGLGPKLTAYEIAIHVWGLDVTLDRTLDWDVDLQEWLEEHADEFEWIHPKWRDE